MRISLRLPRKLPLAPLLVAASRVRLTVTFVALRGGQDEGRGYADILERALGVRR